MNLLLRKIVYIFLFLFVGMGLYAQTDREFWFTSPGLTTQHGNNGGRIKNVVVSTGANPATVTLSVPANSAFKPIVVDIPAFTTERIDLFADNAILEHTAFDVVLNRGLLLESSDNVTAYLEVMEEQNPDIFALKGRHALGMDFYIPLQNHLKNQTYATPNQARSSIDIVATEDGTVVTIVPTKPISKADGTTYPAGVAFTVNLNKGQSYSVRADSELAVDHPAGTRVSSNKPIAVTTKDDSVINGGWDLIGDQLVPVDYLGAQYIIMKGTLNHLTSATSGCVEYGYAVVTENNTELFANGVSLGVFNAGTQVPICVAAADKYVVVKSNNFQKFYVFHVSGKAGEIAGALLPPTDQCSGNSRVGFSYSYGKTGQELYLNLMVQKNAKDGFLFDGAVAAWLNPLSFEDTPDGIWSVARFGPFDATTIPVGTHEIMNTKGLFHLGYVNNTGPGCLYGYFSDFAKTDIKAVAARTNEDNATLCKGEEVKLRVDGGFSYAWTAEKVGFPAFNVMTYFDKTNVYNPTLNTTLPEGVYKFYVTVGGACGEPPVIKTITITIIQGPTAQFKSKDFCESEIGSGCVAATNLTTLESLMTANWPNTSVKKWEKDVFNQMTVYDDYEVDRYLNYPNGKFGNVQFAATNPNSSGINPSASVMRITMSESGTKQNFIKVLPKLGYKFDLSEGKVFTLMAYNQLLQEWAKTGMRSITLRLIENLDSIEVKVKFNAYTKWELMTFDFSSFPPAATSKTYSEMKIIFDVLNVHEQDVFYIDNISKLLDHKVVTILDPTNAAFCSGAKLYATVENDFGCRVMSELTPTISAASFAVNDLNPLNLCQGETPGLAKNVNLSSYANQIIGATGLANGNVISKWYYIKKNDVQLFDDFETTSIPVWDANATSQDQSGTVPFDKKAVNPNVNFLNPSAFVGKIPNKSSNYLNIKMSLANPIKLIDGHIFKAKFAYNWQNDGEKNGAKTVTMRLFGTNGTVTSTAIDIKSANDTRYDWKEVTFDFSANTNLVGIDQVEFIFYTGQWGGITWYIDDLQREMQDYKTIFTQTSNYDVQHGDEFFAIVTDPNGCSVEAKIVASVTEASFPINNLNPLNLCQGATVGVANNVNLSSYTNTILGAAGVAAGNTITKWSYIKKGEQQVIDNFDAAGMGTYTSSITMNESVANPTTTGLNATPITGRLTGPDANTYKVTLNLSSPLHLSDGAVFKLKTAYSWNNGWQNGNAKTLTLKLTGTNGIVTSAAVDIKNTVANNWKDITVDFSASSHIVNVSQIEFTFTSGDWGGITWYFDEIIREKVPYKTLFTQTTSYNVNDGDQFYAQITDPNGCVREASILASVKECGPPARDTLITLCETVAGGGSVAGRSLTALESYIKYGVAAYTVAWFTDFARTIPVATPGNVTATNGLIFYATVTDPGTGKKTDVQVSFTINPLPTLTFTAPTAVCANAADYTISTATPPGGTFSGTGVNAAGLFKASVAGVGSHVITYQYTNANSCTNSITANAVVKPMPNVSLITAKNQTYCGTAGVNLQVTNVASAVYNWTKDTNPIAGSHTLTAQTTGTYTITSTLNGCVETITDITVVGNPLPTYAFSAIDSVCEGGTIPQPQLTLTGTAPWNLTYTVNGVPTTVSVASSPYTIPFAQTAVNVYNFAVTSLQDNKTCSAVIDPTIKTKIEIVSKPSITFSALPERCTNGTAITLSSYVTPTTGSFSGSGVAAGVFTPSASIVGSNTITYSVTNRFCATTATQPAVVNPLPTVNPTASKTAMCVGETITLNGTLTGGTTPYTTHAWTGSTTPLSAINTVNPSFTTSTAGNYPLTYTVTDTKNCTAQKSIAIDVYYTAPPTVRDTSAISQLVNSTNIPFISATGTSIQVYSDAAATTQISTGSPYTPLASVVIDPVLLYGKQGVYTYYFTQTLNGCKSLPATGTLTLTDCPATKPVVPGQTICESKPVPTFTAPASAFTVRWYDAANALITTGNTYTPTVTTPKDYDVWVAHFDVANNCESPKTKVTLTVNPKPVVSIDNVASTYCSDIADVSMVGSPAGGSFTINNAAATVFSPTTLGQGSYKVTYSATNAFTCTDSISKTVQVNYTPPPVVKDTVIISYIMDPKIYAQGSGTIEWFYPAATKVGTGTAFTHGLTTSIERTYTLHQIMNGCTSVPVTKKLTILDCGANALTVTPTTVDICVGEPMPTYTFGSVAANMKKIFVYDQTNAVVATILPTDPFTFTPPTLGSGAYTWRVAQDTGCLSPKTDFTLNVNAKPNIALTNIPNNICIDGAPIVMAATPAGGTFRINNAIETSFNPTTLGQGLHTVSYTVTNAKNCTDSLQKTVEVFYTAPPVVVDTTIISYMLDPQIYAQGSGTIRWFYPAATQVGTGTAFAHGLTTATERTYELNQIINGCVSVTVTKKLTILDCGAAAPTVSSDTIEICDYDAMPTFTFGGIAANMKKIYVYNHLNDLDKTILPTDSYSFTPPTLGVGTYTWKVAQDTGCVSPQTTFTVVVHKKPTAKLTAPTQACVYESPITIVTEPVGGNLTGQSLTGTQFNPAIGAGAYQFEYEYADAYGCKDKTGISINVIETPPPTADDQLSYIAYPTPDLEAQGASIEWYSDLSLLQKVFDGNVYATGITGVVDTVFYATQTLQGCISKPQAVRLVLTDCAVPKPQSTGFIVCEYNTIPHLTAVGDTLQWYATASSKTPIATGADFNHGQTIPKTYDYYVSQKNICESPRTKVSFTIVPKPNAQIIANTQTCINKQTVNIQVSPIGGLLTGVNVSGNVFTPNSAAGDYTQMYEYTDSYGCKDTAYHTITVYETQPPIVKDLTTFSYNLTTTISATGTTVKWYDMPTIQSPLYTGDIFAHGKTQAISKDYYVTQTLNGCESEAKKIRLQILDCGTPKPTVSPDTAICVYSSIPALHATGLPNATLHWFEAKKPTVELSEGASYTPVIPMVVGEYEYFALQDTGCRGAGSYVTITVKEAAMPQIQTISNYCYDGSSRDLQSVATADVIDWYSADPGYPTSQVPVASGRVFNPGVTNPGTYSYFMVRNSQGCVSKPYQVQFTIYPTPAKPIVRDTTSCEGDIISPFAVTNYTSGNVQWYNKSNFLVKDNATSFVPTVQSLTENVPTMFSVKVTENGCQSDTTQVSYILVGKPNPPIISTPHVCEGEPIKPLYAFGAQVYWYAEDGVTLLKPNSLEYIPNIESKEGDYSYYLTQTIHNCTSIKKKATLKIITIPPVKIIGDTTICEGSAAQSYHIENATERDSYQWRISENHKWHTMDSDPRKAFIYVDWYVKGIYTIQVRGNNTYNCTDSSKQKVYVAPYPEAAYNYSIPGAKQFVEYENISQQESISDTSEVYELPITSYWNFGNYSKDSTHVQPFDSIQSPVRHSYMYGFYNVALRVENIFGCANKTSKEVYVDVISRLYIPNAFEPGSESFLVSKFGAKGYNLETFEMYIFDTWGNVVWFGEWNYYKDKNKDLPMWDGTQNGIPLKSDTYIWKVNARFLDGHVWPGVKTLSGYNKFGPVLLIR